MIMERLHQGGRILLMNALKGRTLGATRNIYQLRAVPKHDTNQRLGHQFRWAHFKGFPQDEKGHTYLHPEVSPNPPGPRTVEDFKNPKKNGNWTSYGFDHSDPTVDKYLFHFDTFLWISVVTILSFWVYLYCPDYRLIDWARREAYLQLHKREALGLEPIDKNLVDPARIVLPADEDIEGIIHIRL